MQVIMLKKIRIPCLLEFLPGGGKISNGVQTGDNFEGEQNFEGGGQNFE